MRVEGLLLPRSGAAARPSHFPDPTDQSRRTTFHAFSLGKEGDANRRKTTKFRWMKL
jgi:hypothetical protein